MRHGKQRTKFGRQKSHRKATLKGLARSVLLHQRIRTTHTKAKEAKKVVESLIALAQNDTVASRRRAFSALGDRTIVSKLFKDIAPLFKSRRGGYTRIIPFDFRKGDGASIVFLELTEKKVEEKPKHAKTKTKPEKAPEKKEIKKAREEVAPPAKSAPLPEPTVKEEKTHEETKKEKAKDEDRKIEKQKGFMRKVKGFFRRKTNM